MSFETSITITFAENLLMKIIFKKNIDRDRYKTLVEKSGCNNFFVQPEVLDTICDNWAICTDDYKIALPFAVKSKFGIKSVYQPGFTQATSFVSEKSVSLDLKRQIIEKIKQKFWLIYLGIDEANLNLNLIKNKDTYILPLHKSYNELINSCTKQCIKNIQKSKKKEIIVKESVEVASIVELMKTMLSSKEIVGFKVDMLANVKRLFEYYASSGEGLVYYAYSQEINIVSAVFFIKTNNRYVLFSATNGEGRKTSAKYAIMNAFLEKHAGENAYLDFAGSSIKSIADWNASFGAEKTSYSFMNYRKFKF